MRKTKRWERCMAAAMSALMLLSGQTAYAGGGNDDSGETSANEGLETAVDGAMKEQDNQSQWIIYKEADPKILKDGETWKNLYEITVKDNDSRRPLEVSGMLDKGVWIPSLLAVDGSHFCFTYEPGKHGTLLSPEKIEGTVDGSDLEVLFEYEKPVGASGEGGWYIIGQSAYCDMYAKTKGGEPISGLSLHYDTDYGEDMKVGTVSAIQYGEDGEIIKRTHWDGFSRVRSFRGINGYAQLTGKGTNFDGSVGQITPYLGMQRWAYAILDDAGSVFGDNYGEGNRYIWAFKTNESQDKFTVLAPDGSKVADVIVHCHETDYYSTGASDFDYDYTLENLADGWDISVEMSETSAFPDSLKTGESVPCDPALLMSITAARKSDDGLTPITYEFDGRQDLTFQFEGIEGIKEIKQVYFNCAENVQDADSNWLSWVSYGGEDIGYDLGKGELTIPKDDISEIFYDKYLSVGNTYQGNMTYVAEDGTEKAAYGGWYIKVLEQSDADLADISKCAVSLEQEEFVYNGKAKTPSVTVKDRDAVLKEGTDYTVTYKDNTNVGTAQAAITGKGSYTGSVTKSFAIKKADQKIGCAKSYKKSCGNKPFSLNAKRTAGDGKLTYDSSDKKVASVTGNGKVTIKGAGIATITIKAASTENYNAVNVSVTITVNPAKQTVKSLTSVKGGKLKVKWKKDTNATGYQIQCSTDKNFKRA